MEGTKQLHTKVQVMSVGKKKKRIFPKGTALLNLLSPMNLPMVSPFTTI